MPAEADVLLMLTIFREGQSASLAGPAMVKTKPSHTLERVNACICRWAKVPPAQCALVFNGAPVHPSATVASAGMGTQSAVLAMLAPAAPAPDPQACAMAFAMLDVLDSEMAAAAETIGM